MDWDVIGACIACGDYSRDVDCPREVHALYCLDTQVCRPIHRDLEVERMNTRADRRWRSACASSVARLTVCGSGRSSAAVRNKQAR
jgi:hypothetical protein